MITARPVKTRVLLPLPLSTLEYYFWSDDRREYPTTFPVDLSFSGQLDRQAFLTALRQAQSRHPLLGALIDVSTSWPQWVSSGLPTIPVDWAPRGVPLTLPDGVYIDLRSQVGLRVWVRTGDPATRVVIEFHHACCDGLASMQFIEDLLIFYSIAAGGAAEAPQPNELTAERLRDRAVFETGVPVKPALSILVRDICVTVLLWMGILFRKSALLALPVARTGNRDTRDAKSPLQESAGEPNPSTQILEFEVAVLSSDESQRLRRVARSHGTTQNDLLIRDLLIVLRDWNRLHAGASYGRLRLNVPVNVRGPSDRDMPAVNKIGFAFCIATAGARFTMRSSCLTPFIAKRSGSSSGSWRCIFLAESRLPAS